MSAFLDLRPGTVFADDFRIERALAEGGMGAVYVAEQLSTGKRRALKVMHPQLVPDERSRRRFVEEARVGSRIESEHVVEVVAAGVDTGSGVPWLAMELLDGADLDARVRDGGPMAPAAALGVLEQIGHALGHAHARGIIHRDLKPENVFVARSRRMGGEEVVKILDFGIASTVAESRTAATVTSAIGSPLWMAPEQAQPGAQLRPATDVWALGLIAFFLLTGKSFWASANHPQFTLQALLVEIMTQPIEPASARAATLGAHGLPAGFDAWFARCVDRSIDARFADAGVAIAALRPLLQGVLASPPVSSFAATAPMPMGVAVTAPIVGAVWPSAPAPIVTPRASPPLGAATGDRGPTRWLAVAGCALIVPLVLVVVGVLVWPSPPSVDPPQVVEREPPLGADPGDAPHDGLDDSVGGALVPEPLATEVPPVPEPPAEPVEARAPSAPSAPRASAAEPMEDARACMVRGDNACVIRVLEGRARTEQELSMLIEAYRATGNQARALRHMRTFVSRFPNSPRARAYRQLLERSEGGGSRRPPRPPDGPPPDNPF